MSHSFFKSHRHTQKKHPNCQGHFHSTVTGYKDQLSVSQVRPELYTTEECWRACKQRLQKNIYFRYSSFPGDGPPEGPRQRTKGGWAHTQHTGREAPGPTAIAGDDNNIGDFTHAVVPVSTLTLSVSVTRHYSGTPTFGTGTSRSGFQLQTATATSHLATSLLSPGFTLAGLPGNSREPTQHSSNCQGLYFSFFLWSSILGYVCIRTRTLLSHCRQKRYEIWFHLFYVWLSLSGTGPCVVFVVAMCFDEAAVFRVQEQNMLKKYKIKQLKWLLCILKAF